MFAENLVRENAKKIIVVEKSDIINQSADRPKLNGWTYFSQFDSVSNGMHELSLLKDVVGQDGTIGAIEKVTKKEGTEHTYTIKVSNKKLGVWLNGTYIDFNTGEEVVENGYSLDNDSVVELEVTLDDTENYVTHIKTVKNFDITKYAETAHLYSNNRIDVEITKIGKTELQTPQEMFGSKEVPATNEVIQDFIEKGRAWWNAHTHSTSAKG